MAILIYAPGRENELHEAFQKTDSTIELKSLESSDPEKVELALLWKTQKGMFSKFPNLRAIASLGAGVDHILSDPDLPKDIPITRFVDPSLTYQMADFICAAVFHHFIGFSTYTHAKKWKPIDRREKSNIQVGVLGMGQLGKESALRLKALGFTVRGWSQTPKNIPGIQTFTDKEPFLKDLDILVCLLPLTPETKGILNEKTFSKLKDGAYVINAARGDHLVGEDLLKSVQNKKLSGACLDVFPEEPLPESHAFWKEPRILITPHIASKTDHHRLANQVVENYRRLKRGEELRDQVDRKKGY